MSSPRIPSLDLVRLLAVVLVLGRHLEPIPSDSGLTHVLLTAWQGGGWVGVDLFFVLSGFLVSGLLLKDYVRTGAFSIRRFYVRRWWKILPPFAVLLLVTAMMPATPRWPVTFPRLAAEVLFLQSYMRGVWNHTWSLSVEEHFYLLLPVLLAVLLKRFPHRFLTAILSAAAVVAVMALTFRVGNLAQPYSFYTHLFATHIRLDSLFVGVALAAVYHLHRQQFVALLTPWRWALIIVGAVLLAPAFFLSIYSRWIFVFGYTAFAVGSGMLIVGVLLTEPPSTRVVRWCATVGACSYSLYLWHMPVQAWVVPAAERWYAAPLGFGGRSTVYLVGSIVVGVVMAKVVEWPALRLRDRWFPSEPGVRRLEREAVTVQS